MNYDYEKNMYQTNNLLEDQNELEVSIHLKNIGIGKFRVKQYVLNSNHGSLLDEWIRLNAIENVQPSEISYLENICVSKRKIYDLHSTSTGDLIINCNLLPNEVDLFLINLELD